MTAPAYSIGDRLRRLPRYDENTGEMYEVEDEGIVIDIFPGDATYLAYYHLKADDGRVEEYREDRLRPVNEHRARALSTAHSSHADRPLQGGLAIEAGTVCPARFGHKITATLAAARGVPIGSHPGFSVQHPNHDDPLISCHIPGTHATRLSTKAPLPPTTKKEQ